MMDALSNGNIDQLQILLNQGTQVDFQDDNGDTPLILAVKCHRIDAVRVLLARGASILTTNHVFFLLLF
jgi:ankyrin repeat protein